MIPSRKKSPEEIAALREGLGIPEEMPKPPAQSPKKSPQNEQATPNPKLEVPAIPAVKAAPKPAHTLRKHELPLAPATASNTKTKLPDHRHDAQDMAVIRKREALSKLNQPEQDPVSHLRRMTAHPILVSIAYLLAVATIVLAYKSAYFIAPLATTGASGLIAIYFFIWKKRSRHHAAILTIILLMTLAFGGLHYAPTFNYGP